MRALVLLVLTTAAVWQEPDLGPLHTLSDAFARGDHGYIDGMLVMHNGRVVFERSYAHDYDRLFTSARDQRRGPYNYADPEWHPYYKGSDLHTMQSVTKSVTSALIGIAIGRGEIANVDVPVLPYFDGYRIAADERRQRWTLTHLLTMATGMRWDEQSKPYDDPTNSCTQMEASADWIQFVLDRPMAAEPGTTFVYNSGASQLLSHILKKATGVEADAYAAEHLFKPLGIARFYWKKTPTGHPDTEGGLYLTARDLAKIGQLYLDGGRWNGRQVLPAGWSERSTRPHLAVRGGRRGAAYGYQWWIETGGAAPAYGANGFGGQRLLVVPSLKAVAVFTGWNIREKPPLDVHVALERVVAAFTRPAG